MGTTQTRLTTCRQPLGAARSGYTSYTLILTAGGVTQLVMSDADHESVLADPEGGPPVVETVDGLTSWLSHWVVEAIQRLQIAEE